MQQDSLFEYVMRLSDDSLILGQRLGEWCGHGPILEEDIAITNIALDLIGQSISLYDFAAELEAKGRNHDQLAYLRYENEYKNVLLVEQPNGDFAMTMLRQFFFDAFRLPLYEALMQSRVAQLAAIAAKSVKETRYHLKHSSEWVIRLGDGTEESHRRAQAAIDFLMPYTQEFWSEWPSAQAVLGDTTVLLSAWQTTVHEVLTQAGLQLPPSDGYVTQGRAGIHTEHMSYLLAEMQSLARQHPGATW